jgi:hypothetical protein
MRHVRQQRSQKGTPTKMGRDRGRWTKLGVALSMICSLVGVGLLIAMPSGASILATAGGGPTISSDRTDYAPGATVTLTGTNWDPSGSSVHIVVNDDAGQTWSHSADATVPADGTVQDVFTLPDRFVATYSVTATQTTQAGTLTATTSFTDFDSDFKQCANDDTAGTGICQWIGGALNSGKSTYSEGMSIPQRLVLNDIPTAADHLHTLTFHMDATKGGKHAFDWLTSWEQALALASAEGAVFTDLNDCGEAIQGSLAGLCTTLDGETGANLATPDVPDDSFASHDNTTGQTTQNKINSFETAYGNRTISIQANAPITIQSFTLSHSVADGEDTGDSEIDFTLSWSSDATAVLVKFASHLALGPNFGSVSGWGQGHGASSVSGGPYHVSLDQLANGALDEHPISLGSQDNNVQVGAIPALPQLIVIKDVINDNGGTAEAADFTMNVTGTSATPSSFGGEESPGTTVTLGPGAYSVEETSSLGYTESKSDDCSGSVTFGETKTCTITNNDQAGTLIVQKIIKPLGALTSFTFQTTGTGYAGFALAGGQTNSQSLNAGSYSVKELVPLGWVLTGIGGSSDPDKPYNCTVSGSGGSTGVGDLNTQTATVSLKNGDTVTCVFENTGQGVTRTQGFWATHTPLANIAWFGGTAFGHTFPGAADTLICGRNVDTLGRVMGAFWSDISKTSNGKKRSPLDQVKMQLLQQLVAAELNGSAFGSVPASGSFTAWEAALCGTDQNAIKTAQQQAASFNTAGDSSIFTPGTSADSKNARSVASLAFWDTFS